MPYKVKEIEMTYEEIVTTIENSRRFESLPGVKITARMLPRLGHPERGRRMIHIAGTNGKGSVSAFLCGILKKAGYRTGMFTSPHLVDFRERIQMDGEMISKEAVTRIGKTLLATEFGVQPSMFDYCLAMALLYFKEQACDVMVIETGLGGRWDSTNALGTPEVSVITKIGYDHMQFLGDTLEQIAAEKAGIIKKGTRLILESQEPKVYASLTAEAKRIGVRSCQAIDWEEITEIRYEKELQYFSFRQYKNLSMKMLGIHQCENAAAAILAAETFMEAEREERGADFCVWRSTCIREGLASVSWPGRMEILRKAPFLMVDGAHNSSGVQALKESLMRLFPKEKFHFIMGVMADKDYEEMVDILLPLAIDFTAVTVGDDRGLLADKLFAYICTRGASATCARLPECLFPEQFGGKEKTVALGSLYFIGEIKALNHYGKITKTEYCDKNNKF